MSHVSSNFGVLMDARCRFIHLFSLSIVEIGFLDDSGGSSKPEDEGGKSASGARLPFDGDCCSTGCCANAAPASASEQPISKLVSFFIIIMFSRLMFAIYSESFL